MKKGGKYPGLLRHVLQAIGEKRTGGGAGSVAASKVEKIIKKAVAKRSVNPTKDIYSLRRRRKKTTEERKKKRRRSRSKDATSAYSDAGESYLEDSESDSERSRSRSRTKTPEPADKSKRRSKRKEDSKRRKRRRRHE